MKIGPSESNFFSQLFSSLATDTHHNKAATVAASLACIIFSAGIYLSTKSLNNSEKKPLDVKNITPGETPGEPHIEFNLWDSLFPKKITTKIQINDLPAAKIDFRIPDEIKVVLDKLFENSPYDLKTLPIYPYPIGPEEECESVRKKMKAPVMKGAMYDGRPFVAIKVDSFLENGCGDRSCYTQTDIDYYRIHPHVEQALIIYQMCRSGSHGLGGKGENIWGQLTKGKMYPLFFVLQFTDGITGNGPIQTQKEYFAKIQAILRGDKSLDTNQLAWGMPESQ